METSQMFAVCGEALMDVYPNGANATGMALDARIGGSPFNVAVGLARMRQPVCFVSAVSTDFLGERLMRALSDEGVDSSTVARTDAPTTLSMVGLDERGVPSYAFHGAHGADRQLGLKDIETLPDAVRALHFGSYATVVEPVGSTQRALVERSKGRRFISYDPNVRLNVEPDVDVWRRHLAWMLPRTDLLKVSDEDLGLLVPGVALDDFGAQALAQGARLVVVTRGGEGSVAFTRQARASAPPVPVKVIDTVGAGDTFQAALLTWLAERQLLDGSVLAGLPAQRLGEALQFAGAAAAIVCGRRGADMPRRSELQA
ncbi:carbohydrate kinase family protein [Piscinibacter terrae]|nr:carbohydrate kinase [Albitalea terrae]